MDILHALTLGLVQGLTEFLPVSSTGHLVIVRELFGFSTENGLAFDAVLHLATVLAVGLFFRKEIWQLLVTAVRFVSGRVVDSYARTTLLAVIFGTIPGAVLGLLFENIIETTLRHTLIVALGLLAGTVIMYAADRLAKQNDIMSLKKGFWIGCFQALALLPGMSRSGLTISGGLFNGLRREEATRFAFVLSFPIILGAGLVSLSKLIGTGGVDAAWGPLVLGSIAAFVSGLWAIRFLVNYLKNHTFKVFLWYRVILAGIIVVLYLWF